MFHVKHLKGETMANLISEINLCNVKITPTNQLDFKNKSEQFNYFAGKRVRTYQKCKYVPREGEIFVKGYVDDLMTCNYGYYTNTYNGTSKTFYFWIVGKDLVSRETTRLTIQLDLFQTWLFDWDLNTCMVERETVSDDTFGLHTIPEDFELGDYITCGKQEVEELKGDVCYLLAITDSSSGFGSKFGKTYSGFQFIFYKEDNISLMNTKIQELCDAGKADAIAFISTFPFNLMRYIFADGTWNLNSGSIIGGVEGIISKPITYENNVTEPFRFNKTSYRPRNNKCFIYPYNFLTVKNPSGGNVVLKFEQFEDINNIKFYLESVVTQSPRITLTPIGYCGKGYAIDDSIELQGFGLCSWNNDNYANWFAQNQNSINAQSANARNSYSAQSSVNSNNYGNALENNQTNMYKGVVTTAGNVASELGGMNFIGAGATAVTGGINTALDYTQGKSNASNDLTNANLLNTTNYQNTMRSIVASVKDAMVQPNTCKGDTSTSGLDMARGTNTFFLERTCVKPEYAKIIDMYFQMYGYQVNEVKVPTFNTREKWNYLKTVNCTATGEIPREDIEAINAMFNNGLTVWHNDSYMYMYNQDNEIL